MSRVSYPGPGLPYEPTRLPTAPPHGHARRQQGGQREAAPEHPAENFDQTPVFTRGPHEYQDVPEELAKVGHAI